MKINRGGREIQKIGNAAESEGGFKKCMRLHLAEGKKFPSREKAVGESIARALTLRLSKRNKSLSLEETKEEGERREGEEEAAEVP